MPDPAPYVAPNIGTHWIFLERLDAGIEIAIGEFGLDGYQRAIENTVVSSGRTGGNVTIASGLPREFQHYRWEFTCRLDPTRAAMLEAAWSWQQQQIVNQNHDCAITLGDHYRKTEFGIPGETPMPPFAPGSEETFGVMQRGYGAFPVLLSLPSENHIQYLGSTLVEVKFGAIEIR